MYLEWDIGAEALYYKGTYFYAYDDTLVDKDSKDNVVKRFGVATLTYSGVRKNLQRNAIAELAGKVNIAEWKGFDAETLLFNGARAVKTSGSDGDSKWQINFSFSFKQNTGVNVDPSGVTLAGAAQGWNLIWRPGHTTSTGTDIEARYEKVLDGQTGHALRAFPYETGDFNDLGIG